MSILYLIYRTLQCKGANREPVCCVADFLLIALVLERLLQQLQLGTYLHMPNTGLQLSEERYIDLQAGAYTTANLNKPEVPAV